MAARRFSKAVTAAIAKDKILGVQAGSGDHRFIGVWVVVVDGRVFIRSWGLKRAGWYQAFVNGARWTYPGGGSRAQGSGGDPGVGADEGGGGRSVRGEVHDARSDQVREGICAEQTQAGHHYRATARVGIAGRNTFPGTAMKSGIIRCSHRKY